MDKKIIKLAVPTDDGNTIFKKMLGQAQNFNIYTINKNGNFQFLETRKNPYAKTLQHLKTLDVYEIINDCPVILSAKIGNKGIERLRERNVHLIFKQGDIRQAITEVIKSDDKLLQLINKL